jgi:hypothetical protein
MMLPSRLGCGTMSMLSHTGDVVAEETLAVV